MYILLTGSTGVGKSSIMERILLQKETLQSFSDPYINNPFLTDAYTTNRMVCQSQIFFMKEFFKIHKKINALYNNYNIIQERSIYECVHIFCRLFQSQGKIDKNEYELLKDLLDVLQSELQLPDIIIYLTASPSIIKERIKYRNRDFENSIDLSFIEVQQRLYIEWLDYFYSKFNIPFFTINNGDLSIEQTEKMVYNHIKQIL